MRRVLALIPCALAFGVMQLSAASAQELSILSSDRLAALDKLIVAAMSRKEVPGLTVAVAVNNRLVLNAGYGMADLENFVPATARTKIRTASISKWLTATAAIRLVEDGKLDLDAAPQRYCEEYPRKSWPMQVRQLLNHTAGVRHYYGSNDEAQDTPSQRAVLEEQERRERFGQFVRYTDTTGPLDAFKADPLLHEPGTRYHYTSHGYRLLGCVLAGASGESYSALMARVVFEPAGMRDTTEDDAWRIISHRASGYATGPGGELRRADFRDVSENLPAGGHLSTARDLVSFALAFGAGRLVQPASVRRMVEAPHLPAAQEANRHYGFGIEVAMLPGGEFWSHSGAQNGTATYLGISPAERFAVAVMMNKEGGSPRALGEAIRNALVTSKQEN